MNLVSCEGCGVVLDRNRLNFPDPDKVWKDDGSVDLDLACYSDGEYVPKVPCPVCEDAILES